MVTKEMLKMSKLTRLEICRKLGMSYTVFGQKINGFLDFSKGEEKSLMNIINSSLKDGSKDE